MTMGLLELSATLLTAGMFLAGLGPARQQALAGATGPASAAPPAATLANCALWLRYGVLRTQPAIVLVNVVGAASAAIALYIFCKFTDNRANAESLVQRTIGFIYLVYLYVWMWYSPSTLQQLGLVASISSIAMFGSPLLSLAKVLKTKSTTGHISFTMASISLIVCILWTLFGFQINDMFVIVPNGIGGALCVVQIVTFLVYNRSKYSPVQSHLSMSKVDYSSRSD